MARLARAMCVCMVVRRRPGSGTTGDNRSPGERPAKPKRTAYDKALGLLARREHSRKELKTKLRQGGYEGEETSAAIERLEEQHYQDDDRFGEVLLRSRISQGYGPMRLRVELKSHGLADARIRELLDDAEVDWDASAAAQLRRRYGGAGSADPAERARRAQFLLRRGFAAATVRSVTRAEVDEADDIS
ncbi:regulatory protein RecX [Rhodanobacter sp. AS-Z3]|uniref:regulatory protein RecX n=1 Tax=Rhodanobacter sp. AS-Z3 TaxID=3031330 RepID=UPI00247AEBD1|nr:regulatory protein RecX [Rhodanobacter sp. AS-Z3]WEN14353.1 regulatory protein RecX [Rhodanobacter sp. AS-Z3]